MDHMPPIHNTKSHSVGSSLELSGANNMDNDDRDRVLAIIDQFRELGVSEDISLSQLVIVGDQSSGKSSLLFATQIVLRRAPASEASVSISIIPGPAANVDEDSKNKLLDFSRAIDLEEFGSEDFTNILDERSAGFFELEKRFSDDILKIELSHPDHHRLSVVDVPGLFRNPTKYQTAEDKVIIRDLIQGYITHGSVIIQAGEIHRRRQGTS